MTRPIERIPAILKIIEEAWIANPDLRLMQLLENAGLSYNTEDLGGLISALHYSYGTTPLIWGTYGKDGKSPLKYVELKDMETSHIINILKTQYPTPPVERILLQELYKRTSNN